MTQKSAAVGNDTPEHIGTLTCITSPLWWIIVAVLATVGVALAIWAIIGEVFVTVSGLGFVVPEQGQITVVSSRAAGRVVKLLVNSDDEVKAGDAVAEIAQPHLKAQVDAAQAVVSLLERQRQRQAKQTDEDLARRGSATQAQIATQQAKLQSLQENSTFRAKVLADMEDEMKQGFTTRTQVEQARSDKINTDLSLRDTATQIQTLRTQLEEDRATAQRQLFTLDQDILKAKQQVEDLQQTLLVSQKVVAPIDGRIASISTAEGKMVAADDQVAVMQPNSPGIVVAAYFQVADGKQVKPGAKVRVTIGSIDSDVYGTADGVVQFVSELPSTTESLKNTIENKTMVAQIERAGSPIKALVTLEPIRGKPGYIKMSSGRASPVPITVGTTVTTQVIVQKSIPISYVIRLFN